MVSPAPRITRLTLAAARPFLPAVRPAGGTMRSWGRRFFRLCRAVVFAMTRRCYYTSARPAPLFCRPLLALDVLVVGLDPVLLDRVLRVLQLDRLVADHPVQLQVERLL